MIRRIYVLVAQVTLVLALLCFVGVANAAPRVKTSISAERVALGDRFSVTLSLTDDEQIARVGSAALVPPVGMTSSGPQMSTGTKIRIVNGVSTTSSTVGLTWVLTATREGKFRIPAPTVVVDGTTITGQATEVEVQRGLAPQPLTTSPFGPPGGLFSLPSNPLDFDPDPTIEDDDSNDSRELAMTTATDEPLFIRAIVDREKAFVGQQVTASYYVYFRVDFEMTERQEAQANDFLRTPLLSDPGSTTVQYTRVGGKRYGARLVDKVALFPLKAGKLSVGTLSGRFNGRRLGARVQKVSNDVSVEVEEPPIAGRPAGYVLGDVGQYTMSATVTPRQVLQSGSVSVTVRIEGVGSVPSSVKMPPQKGVEWLEPEKKDAIAPKNGVVGGSRSFGYVAVLKNSGKVDLGTVELSFWNPESKQYELAKASLGEIEVTPTSPTPGAVERAKSGETTEDILAKLPDPRTKLGEVERAKDRSLSPATTAAWIFAPPVTMFVGLALVGLRKRAAGRTRSVKDEANRRAKGALKNAASAEKAKDVRAVARETESALYARLEAKLGKNFKGMTREEQRQALAATAVDAEWIEKIQATLALAEELAYSPDASADDMAKLVDDARGAMKHLER